MQHLHPPPCALNHSGLFHGDQFIVSRADPDAFRVFKRDLPVGIRRYVLEVIVMIRVLMQGVEQHGVRHHGLAVASVGAGRVQSNGVERSEHAHVRDNRHIIAAVAVTVRGYLHNDRNMEARPVLHDGLCVLRYLHAKLIQGHTVGAVNRIRCA